MLFPLVIYIDELVQLRLSSIAAPWQPFFQRELYKIDNGGERFYQGIDNLLSKSDTPPIIFEVFYFCLVHGFRGRYVHDSEKVKFYRSVLSQRIPTRHLVSGDPEKKPRPIAFIWFLFQSVFTLRPLRWALWGLCVLISRVLLNFISFKRGQPNVFSSKDDDSVEFIDLEKVREGWSETEPEQSVDTAVVAPAQPPQIQWETEVVQRFEQLRQGTLRLLTRLCRNFRRTL